MSSLDTEILDHASALSMEEPAGGARAQLREELTRNVMAIVDQGLVSGTRFLTSVLVGRFAGKEELGLYSLGFTAVLLVACVQEALISLPYSVFAGRHQGDARAAYAGSTSVLSVAIASVSLVILLATSLAVFLLGGDVELAAIFGILAITSPALALLELLRRFALAQLKPLGVLCMDTAACALQLGLLWGMAKAEVLTAATAFGAIGIGAAVIVAVWLPSANRTTIFEHRGVREVLLENWRFARWAFASQITGALRVSIIPWLLASLSGKAVTGTFAAIATLALFANPLVLGISSVMIPAAAIAFHHHGHDELRRMVVRTVAMCAVMTLGLAAVLIVFRHELLMLFYGSQYEAGAEIVALLCAGMVLEGIGTPPGNALWVEHRPMANFVASLLGMVATAMAGGFLIGPYGLWGAATAFFVGRAVCAVVQCWAYFAPRRGDSSSEVEP